MNKEFDFFISFLYIFYFLSCFKVLGRTIIPLKITFSGITKLFLIPIWKKGKESFQQDLLIFGIKFHCLIHSDFVNEETKFK